MDGVLYANNHPNVQQGYRVSEPTIVSRRGTDHFTPCDTNVNDFVQFYFSPFTAMAYTIHKGNVPPRDPDGNIIGDGSMDDVAFIVADPFKVSKDEDQYWFSNIACNSAILPAYENDISKLDTHIDWTLFDEDLEGNIPEIGYGGCCRWQHDRDNPVRYQQRRHKRMAEFLLKDALIMKDVTCIVLKHATHKADIERWITDAGLEIPVYVKSGCYYKP